MSNQNQKDNAFEILGILSPELLRLADSPKWEEVKTHGLQYEVICTILNGNGAVTIEEACRDWDI